VAITSLTLAVVGADHPNKRGPTRRFGIAVSAPGDPIELVLEPKNPADPNAVIVLNKHGIQIGYLTAERAPWIGGMMKAGRDMRAVFQDATEYGALIRLAFDGAELDLPAPLRKRPRGDEYVDEDPGFFPDESPPDE
jgi:hypothetical protein